MKKYSEEQQNKIVQRIFKRLKKAINLIRESDATLSQAEKLMLDAYRLEAKYDLKNDENNIIEDLKNLVQRKI